MASFSLNTSLGTISSSITANVILNSSLSTELGDFTLDADVLPGPANFSLYAELYITPHSYLFPTPIPTAHLDPFHDPVWVAVEFDLYDENDDPITLRLCNRGIVTRTVSGTQYQYLPRIADIPIELGTTITVTSYGSPVRGQPNGGLITFAIDEAVWNWFLYRWIGQVFRVYYGKSVDPVTADVDLDMSLIYVGRIASEKHDTLKASIETTDEAVNWDNPLITDFYDNSFPVALRGKPKPQLWGTAFEIEPQIEDEADQIYAVSYRTGGLDNINEVRVGGIPWNRNDVGPPIQGEWTPDLANGKFSLGSPPLGFDVRCDAQQGTFTIGSLIESIVTSAGGTVDANSMANLNNRMPGEISYVSGTTPVNVLDAIDDIVTKAGCWWAVGPLGAVIAGVIDVPDTTGLYVLDNTNIKSIELTTVHPPAWRIRVGYKRNWDTESTFAPSVLQTTQAAYKEDSVILEPHYDNSTVKTLEPRAVDVPRLDSSFVFKSSASSMQTRLITAWGTVRSLFNVSAYVLPENINLYDTVSVNYMMVTGNFRIVSAIRAIGTGPATLQLWGTIGPYAVMPPETLPQTVADMGIWVRTSGSGTFVVGTDTPDSVRKLWVRGIGAGGGGANWAFDVPNLIYYNGGGGGAGGYFEDFLTVSSGSSFSWSIGEGGRGSDWGIFAAYPTVGAGQPGGDTTFGSAVGGGGDPGQTVLANVNPGLGGTSTGATVTVQGGPGGVGFIGSQDDNLQIYTANGGAGAFGGGSSATTALSPSGAPGGGGGGHVSTFVDLANSGNDGIIIVIWFE